MSSRILPNILKLANNLGFSGFMGANSHQCMSIYSAFPVTEVSTSFANKGFKPLAHASYHFSKVMAEMVNCPHPPNPHPPAPRHRGVRGQGGVRRVRCLPRIKKNGIILMKTAIITKFVYMLVSIHPIALSASGLLLTLS